MQEKKKASNNRQAELKGIYSDIRYSIPDSRAIMFSTTPMDVTDLTFRENPFLR